MIASNYRRFPEAMALQFVLVFGRSTWHTERPKTRHGRAMRAERSNLVKQTPQVVRWVASAVPAWWREAKRAAKALAKQVKTAMRQLDWEAAAAKGDVLGELFEKADRFEAEHEDSYRWNHMSAMVKGRRSAVWEHYGVGCGCSIPSDYRA